MSAFRIHLFGLLLAGLALLAAGCGDSAQGATTTAPADTAGATDSSVAQSSSTAAPTTTSPVPMETAPVAITGEGLPVVAAGEDAAIGLSSPRVAGVDFYGNDVVLGDSDGPQAIMFVAHWCPHCQDEVPAVQAWVDETGGVEGVEIVAVSTAVVPERPNYPPSEWFAGESWSSPVMIDDAEASSFLAFGGQAIPFWVFVDGAGNVYERIEGGVDVATLEAVMNDLAGNG
jgi:thiol-disulfide isomerase/thioredoxin